MKIGTFSSGHEIHRDGRRKVDGGEGRVWSCVSPDGSVHALGGQPCAHLVRMFTDARSGTLPRDLELTADGGREAVKCGCIARAGGYKPKPEVAKRKAGPDGNAAERRARDREEKHVAWLSLKTRDAEKRARSAARDARRAETSAEAALLAALAAEAAKEAWEAAEQAAGGAGRARARAAALRAKMDAKQAEAQARAAAAVERAHGELPPLARSPSSLTAKPTKSRKDGSRTTSGTSSKNSSKRGKSATKRARK